MSARDDDLLRCRCGSVLWALRRDGTVWCGVCETQASPDAAPVYVERASLTEDEQESGWAPGAREARAS